LIAASFADIVSVTGAHPTVADVTRRCYCFTCVFHIKHFLHMAGWWIPFSTQTSNCLLHLQQTEFPFQFFSLHLKQLFSSSNLLSFLMFDFCFFISIRLFVYNVWSWFIWIERYSLSMCSRFIRSPYIYSTCTCGTLVLDLLFSNNFHYMDLFLYSRIHIDISFERINWLVVYSLFILLITLDER